MSIRGRFALTCVGVVTILLWIGSASALPAAMPVAAEVGSPAAGALVLGPDGLLSATVNTTFSATLTVTGGSAPYTFGVTDGRLPNGLALDSSTGVLSGTPTTANAFPFVVTVRDSAMHFGIKRFVLIVSPGSVGTLTLGPDQLPNGTVNTAYNATLTASGGTDPYTFTITDGELPTGLSLDSTTGAISGTPTDDDVESVVVTATDSAMHTGTRHFFIAIMPNIGTLTIVPDHLQAATVNVSYTATLTASGGTGPYTFTITDGSLPTGLSLDGTTGIISGTPTVSEILSFVVTATDSAMHHGNKRYVLMIDPGSIGILTIGPDQLPSTVVNTPFTATLTVSGGTGPYTFTLTDGKLPDGLMLDPTSGIISGTPTTPGIRSFVVTVTDSAMQQGSRRFFLAVFPPVSMQPDQLPDATQGSIYHAAVSTTVGSAGPYTFAVTAGSLPAGLMLDANTGRISGVSTASGQSTFTVTATDIFNHQSSRQYTITVNPTGTVTLVGIMLKGTVTSGKQIGDDDHLIVSEGSVVTLAATGIYSDGSRQPLTSGVTFTSSDTAKATVDASGLVTTAATGAVIITATDSNVVGKLAIYVGAPNMHPDTRPTGMSAGTMPHPQPIQPTANRHPDGTNAGTAGSNGGNSSTSGKNPNPAPLTAPMTAPNAQPNRH